MILFHIMRKLLALRRKVPHWLAIDQLMLSIASFLPAFFVAINSNSEQLGLLTLGTSIILLLQSFSRALMGDTTLILKVTARIAITNSVVVFSVPLITIGIFLFATDQEFWGLVLLSSSVATLTDTTRCVLLSQQRYFTSYIASFSWVIFEIVALLSFLSNETGAAKALLVWSIGGLISILVGLLVTRFQPMNPRVSLHWWNKHARRIARPLALEVVLAGVSSQIALWMLLPLIGEAGLGEIRAAQLIFTPVTLISSALALHLFSIPTFSLQKISRIYSLLFILATFIWAVLSFCVLRFTSLNQFSINSVFDVHLVTFSFVFGVTAISVFTMPKVVFLKVVNRFRPILVARITALLVGPTFIYFCFVLYGEVGAIAGWFMSSVMSSLPIVFTRDNLETEKYG